MPTIAWYTSERTATSAKASKLCSGKSVPVFAFTSSNSLPSHSTASLFFAATSSEEARSCKPDPGIFHYALAKSGLGIDEVLFVGDSLHHDVAGAAAVGMRSVRIVEDGVRTPLTDGLEVTAEPSYEIRDLTELVDIVASCNHA